MQLTQEKPGFHLACTNALGHERKKWTYEAVPPKDNIKSLHVQNYHSQALLPYIFNNLKEPAGQWHCHRYDNLYNSIGPFLAEDASRDGCTDLRTCCHVRRAFVTQAWQSTDLELVTGHQMHLLSAPRLC